MDARAAYGKLRADYSAGGDRDVFLRELIRLAESAADSFDHDILDALVIDISELGGERTVQYLQQRVAVLGECAEPDSYVVNLLTGLITNIRKN